MKAINNLDEVNQLNVGERIGLWDYEMGKAHRMISENEPDYLSIIRWVAPMMEGYVINEERIDKFWPEEIEMFGEIIKVPKKPCLSFCNDMIYFKWWKPLNPSEKEYHEGDEGYNERFELLRDSIKRFEDSL
ncbi:MAG: hypothetical protein KKF67_00835 [Nanoarchaeota archaeon]|nr:hypothetical protein [Nanoarchaeota archaeon]